MKHVSAVRDLLNEGKSEEAEDALENLLALGPSNIEALKIKAAILGKKGQLAEEAETWLKISQIDGEDPDAHDFLLRLQLEERERYFFTEIVKDEGRRFFAYPKKLFHISVAGLVGCVAFLFISSAPSFEGQLTPESLAVITGSFFLLVVCPWLAILYLYFKSLKTLTVSKAGVEITTRLKSLSYAWNELEAVHIIYGALADGSNVRLVLVPTGDKEPRIEIDLSAETSALKAKNQLIHELQKSCSALTFIPDTDPGHLALASKSSSPLRF